MEDKVVNIGTFLNTGRMIKNKVKKTCDYYSENGWELVNFQSYDISTKVLLVFKKEKND